MLGNKREYEVMNECEKVLWWYDALHRRTLSSIATSGNTEPSILDLGCGTGGLLFQLQAAGYNDLRGYDLSQDAVEFALGKGLPVSQGDAKSTAEALSSNRYDIIIMHDVLYFFTESEQASILENLVRALRPSGKLLMNLPAFDIFAGTHDQAVGITKRFDRESVRNLVSGTAIAIEYKIHYWPFLLSPIVALVRTFQRLKRKLSPQAKEDAIHSDLSIPPAAVNNALKAITKLETTLGLDHFFGSSIFLEITKR